MIFQLASRWFICLLFASGLGSAQAPKADVTTGKKPKHLLRFICVSSMVEDQEVVLASINDEGQWNELGTLALRSALISGWIPAQTGELHLGVSGPNGFKSICRFNFPAGAGRAVAVLLPDPEGKGYKADVIDPAKQNFVKGSALLVNYSSMTGTVFLGSQRTELAPGKRKIVKVRPEDNGMYRMLAAYTGKDKKLVPCYDRYVSSNGEARDLIFLLPDPTLGLKVFSLSEFGPFD